MAGDLAFSSLSWFSSELTSPRERYLARVITQTLAESWRSPDDFLRHFTPRKLMHALAEEDTLRAAILIGAAGVHAKLAKKKPPESAAEDLELALEEGVTDAGQILELLPVDDQVRLLDARELWAFATEDGFWRSTPDDTDHRRAVTRIAFLLESALHEELISLHDVVQGVGFSEIAGSLPPARLKDVVRHALELGQAGRPLDEAALLEVAPLSDLLEFVPLEHVWQTILAERIAKPLDFGEPAVKSPSTAPPLTNLEEDPDLDTAFAAIQSAPPAPPAAAAKSKPPPPAPPAKTASPPPLPVRPPAKAAPTASERPPLEDEARQRVYARLSRMDRLPPAHESLPLPVLLSIESMYSELLTFNDDEAREQCIRDSFPNEQHLRTAMLALIDLLDPTIETKRSTIKDTDVESLIAVVLFEERQRQEQKAAHKAARSGQRATPASGTRAPSSIPPPPSGARSLRALTPPAPLAEKR